ncbi:MAG: HlyD family efflux transporter periplasmic adaptor subunit [Solimonas sp.]
MKRPPLAVALVLLCAVAGVAAHEGEQHEVDALPAVSSADRPRRVADDEWYVPKAVQRALRIQTAASGEGETVELLAEAIADPASGGALTAPQPGRLEAAGAWPLAGRRVARGEVIAWLRPLLSQREDARRRADLAQLEQALQVARINAERLRVQSEGTAGIVTTGNVYREQAELELQLAQRRRELETQALQERVAIRAPADGVIATAGVREGEVVAAGQGLFDVVDPRRLWLAAYSDQPRLAARLAQAELPLADAAPLMLALRGVEPLAARPGWRLLFEPALALPLLPGEMRPVRVRLSAVDKPALPAAACVTTAQGGVIWRHVAPERFRVQRVADCALRPSGDDAAARLVTRGAALLSQYL